MAQLENETGVGMAPQYAAYDSSVRQPSVSYQAAVRMPDAPIASKVSEPKTDWVNYILSEGGRAADAYDKLSKAGYNANVEAAKKAEEDAKIAAKNELARQIARVDEKQRQKGYGSSSEAVTDIRRIQDDALAAGVLTEKDIYDITSHYAKPTMTLDEALQKQEQTFDVKQEEEKVTNFIKQHPSYTGASKSTVLGIIDKADNSLDMLVKLINDRNKFKSGTEEYKVRDKALEAAMKTNIDLNLCVYLSDLIGDTPITPQVLQEIKNKGMRYYTNLGGNSEVASVLIDRFFDRTGANYVQEQYINTNKISKEAIKNAIENISLNAEYQYMTIPGVAILQKAGGQYLSQLVAEEFSTLGLTEDIAQGISLSTGLLKVVKDAKGKTKLVSNLTPEMIKGLNNLQADGSTTPYMRGLYGLGTLTLINDNNKVTYKDTTEDIKVALNNFDGTFSRLNLSALKRDAKRLLATNDPESEEIGQKTEEEISKLEGNKITAEILGKPSVVKQAFEGLRDSLNASELRYDKDGKLFLSGTSGILGGISSMFRLRGGEGSYEEQIKTINNGLSMYTDDVESKKQVLENMGASALQPGDFDILSLNTREGQQEYIKQRSERADNVGTGLFKGVGEKVSNIWNSSNTGESRGARNIFNIDKPTTTTSTQSYKSSQTFDVAQPFVYEGNIDLDERPVYNNEDGTVSTELSTIVGHDGKYYIIPTIRTEDGERIDMTEDEADKYFLETGEHLGEYDSIAEAEEASKIISGRFENPGIAFDPVNKRMVDPRDLKQNFGETAISRGETPARLEDFHKDLLISQETLDKKPDLKVYKDSLKHDTIGYGHKLTDAEKASGKFKKGITEEEAWELFEKDYAQAVKDVDSILKEKGIDYIPEEARLVLVNMAYNMGKGYVTEDGKKHKGLKSFVKMFEGIKEGDINKIVKEMIDSKWYKQVTNRANALIDLMIQAYK